MDMDKSVVIAGGRGVKRGISGNGKNTIKIKIKEKTNDLSFHNHH